jgi:GT2 family glycosyltransferase
VSGYESNGASPTAQPAIEREDDPVWSVMVPTYRPSSCLRETLEGVLAQDPGPRRMQIEVVDDGTPDDVAGMVADIGGPRVTFTRNARRLGLVGNWNECVRRARGKFVHILHQDDIVLPGFYAAMEQGLEGNPTALAGFCRHVYMDEQGMWRFLSDVEAGAEGILPDWRRRFAEGLSVQCPAMVVRRSAYRSHGGFDESFPYGADVEMWARLASRGPIFHTPRVLAAWRMHGAAASRWLMADGQHIRDGFALCARLPAYFPDLPGAADAWHRRFLGHLRDGIRDAMAAGNMEQAARHIRLLWTSDRGNARTRRCAVGLGALLGRTWCLAGLRGWARGVHGGSSEREVVVKDGNR